MESRGLAVSDPVRAERYLSAIGYYRLSAYTRPFQRDFRTHQFEPDMTFDDVLNLYIFDRQLRLTLLDALERVEVAMRARVNDIMCSRTGNTHWYLDATLFNTEYEHGRMVQQVEEHQDDFVKSYKQKYTDPAEIPAWMAVQALSFGAIQKLLKALGKREQEAICGTFGFQPRPMVTWLYAMTALRNNCAHHARTWNRTFHVNLPVGAPTPTTIRAPLTEYNKNKLDGYVLVLDTFMQHVSPGSHWHSRLAKLVQDYHDDTPHDFHRADLQRRAGHLLTLPVTGAV